MPYFRVKTSNGWAGIKNISVKTSSGWQTGQKVFVKTNTGWTIVWPFSGPYPITTPDIYTNTSTTNTAYPMVRLGTTIYGFNGTWNNNGYTNGGYTYYWTTYDSLNANINPISGTTNTLVSYATLSLNSATLYDNKFLTFTVNYLSQGSVVASASNDTGNYRVQVVKNSPVNISHSISPTTPTIGTSISYSSSWNINYAYSPDAARSTIKWYRNLSNSVTGGTEITSASGSYTYTPTSADSGYYIYAVETCFNSGSDYDYGTSTGVSVSNITSSAVSSAPPTNTSVPYSICISGTPGKVGSTYRLYAGSWTNSPSSFDYFLDRQDQNGTNVLSVYNQANSYYDWTAVNNYAGKKLDYSVIAYNGIYPNNSSIRAYGASLGPFTYNAPTAIYNPSISGSGAYNSYIYYSAGSYNYGTVSSTKLIVSASTTFSSTSISKTATSTYLITSTDVANPAYYFVTMDTVAGFDGNTYYFYSGGYSTTGTNSVSISDGYGAILSYEISGATAPTLSSTTSTTNGFTFYINNISSTYTYTSSATNNATVSINTTSGLVTVTGLNGGAGSNVTINAKRLGYQIVSNSVFGSSIAAPSQLIAPSISSTAIYPNSITWSGGVYSNASAVTSVLMYSTSASNFSPTFNIYKTVSPYQLTANDVTTPAYIYEVRDTVVGTNGSTYYYYSSATTSQEGTGSSPTFGTVTSAQGGWSVPITSTSTDTYSVVSTTAGSASISGTTLTVNGLGSQASATVTVSRKTPGYTLQTGTVSGTSQALAVPSGGTVTLSGSGKAGTTLTASTSGWSGSPTSYNIYIYASTNNPPTMSNVQKASSTYSSTYYTITTSDAASPAFYFKAFATATNAGGTSSTTAESSVILSYPVGTVTAPTITTTDTSGAGGRFNFSSTFTNLTIPTYYFTLGTTANPTAYNSLTSNTNGIVTTGRTTALYFTVYATGVDGGGNIVTSGTSTKSVTFT